MIMYKITTQIDYLTVGIATRAWYIYGVYLNKENKKSIQLAGSRKYFISSTSREKTKLLFSIS